MKIKLLIAILAIPGASLHAQTSRMEDLAQRNVSNPQIGLVAQSPPQPQDSANQADATPAAAGFPQWRGQYEGDPEFSTQVIKTQHGWFRLWRKLGRPIPQVLDETREMAVYISVGRRPTGGFRPEITSAVVREGQFVVAYTDGRPSPEMFVTQALTQPWVVGLVPATSLPVAIEEQGEER